MKSLKFKEYERLSPDWSQQGEHSPEPFALRLKARERPSIAVTGYICVPCDFSNHSVNGVWGWGDRTRDEMQLSCRKCRRATRDRAPPPDTQAMRCKCACTTFKVLSKGETLSKATNHKCL